MKTVKLKIIVLLFLLLCVGITAAENSQDADLINFESAWEMMKANNIELQRLLIDQEILLRESGNKKYWIPGISAGASLSRSSPLLSYLTNPENESKSEVENWSLRGSIDLRLGFSFNISLTDQKEAVELSILMLQRRSRERDLKTSLMKLYYQIITGINTIELHEQSLSLAQNRLEQIQTQYNQGLRSDLELLSAKIAAAKDLPALEKAKVDQEKRNITFRDYLGLNEDVSFSLSDDLSTISPFNKDNLKILNDENLQIAELELKLAEITKELAEKNLYTPSLNLSLGWSSNINPLFDPVSWSADEWNDGIGLGLSFSVPISTHFDGTEGRLNLQKLEDNIKKVKLSFEGSRQSIKKEFQFLMQDFELSKFNIEASELNVELQELNFGKVQDNFEAGRASLLELNESRQALQAARISLENERLNQLFIQIDLERIIE